MKHLLPFEQIKRKILVKKQAKTDEKLGCKPEERKTEEIIKTEAVGDRGTSCPSGTKLIARKCVAIKKPKPVSEEKPEEKVTKAKKPKEEVGVAAGLADKCKVYVVPLGAGIFLASLLILLLLFLMRYNHVKRKQKKYKKKKLKN